jgi:hypothetical protein
MVVASHASAGEVLQILGSVLIRSEFRLQAAPEPRKRGTPNFKSGRRQISGEVDAEVLR